MDLPFPLHKHPQLFVRSLTQHACAQTRHLHFSCHTDFTFPLSCLSICLSSLSIFLFLSVTHTNDRAHSVVYQMAAGPARRRCQCPRSVGASSGARRNHAASACHRRGASLLAHALLCRAPKRSCRTVVGESYGLRHPPPARLHYSCRRGAMVICALRVARGLADLRRIAPGQATAVTLVVCTP